MIDRGRPLLADDAIQAFAIFPVHADLDVPGQADPEIGLLARAGARP
jgi:hypothetical protein